MKLREHIDKKQATKGELMKVVLLSEYIAQNFKSIAAFARFKGTSAIQVGRWIKYNAVYCYDDGEVYKRQSKFRENGAGPSDAG